MSHTLSLSNLTRLPQTVRTSHLTSVRQLTALLFGMLLFVKAVSSEEHLKFDELEYFDRELIVKHQISEIQLTITEHRRSAESDEQDRGCIIYNNKFDRNGNIIRRDLNRSGSYNYYHYDDNGNLRDWGWQDKNDGEITSIAQGLKDEGSDHEKIRQKTQNELLSSLIKKSDYRIVSLRAVQDPCHSLDALYEISHKNTGGLPREAMAKWKKELGTFMPKNHKSADVLYIYYDYIYQRRYKVP